MDGLNGLQSSSMDSPNDVSASPSSTGGKRKQSFITTGADYPNGIPGGFVSKPRATRRVTVSAS